MLVPVQCAEAIKALMPNAEINIMPGVGHIPFLSHTDAFLQLLLPFIEQPS
jgi:pimeloyl-ACP methyl ester carboxylesterase